MHDTPPPDAARHGARHTARPLPEPRLLAALRHPAFLLWLERFAGTRADGRGLEYEVGRAADGLLEARDADGRRVLVGDALRGTALVRPRLTFDALVAAPPPAPRRTSELTRISERWGSVHTSGSSYLSGMPAGITDLLRLAALVERRGREHDAERARGAALAAWAAAVPSPRRAPEDWAMHADLAAEHDRVRHAEPYPIPAAFVFRAQRHFEEQGRAPLLEYRYADYRATLVAARGADGAYELRTADGDAPVGMWRDDADRQAVSEVPLHAEHGLAQLRLDDAVPGALHRDSPGDEDRSAARAHAELESLGVAGDFACPEKPDARLGSVTLLDDAESGSGRCRRRRARVSSPIALACLQYRLDDLGAAAALRIELREP